MGLTKDQTTVERIRELECKQKERKLRLKHRKRRSA